jgi:hypothetical protein
MGCVGVLIFLRSRRDGQRPRLAVFGRHRLRTLREKEMAPDYVVQICNLLTVTGQQQEYDRLRYVFSC